MSREESHTNLAQRVALWAAYALFTVALGAAVLLRGGVYPQQWAWCALGITVAGMLVVFAVWAVFGFAFPAEPLPLALNVISKILCFVAAIMLFVWRADGEVSGAQA